MSDSPSADATRADHELRTWLDLRDWQAWAHWTFQRAYFRTVLGLDFGAGSQSDAKRPERGHAG
jgi:hypothetical protein